MMELNATLEFACTSCELQVMVTVHCTGERLCHESIASVNVPCPTCGQVNQLYFEPSGRVRSVRPYSCVRVLPDPSVN